MDVAGEQFVDWQRPAQDGKHLGEVFLTCATDSVQNHLMDGPSVVHLMLSFSNTGLSDVLESSRSI